MSVLIDEPFENSIYNKLSKHSVGHQLIGYFLQLRAFYLGSLTTSQLIFTLECMKMSNLQESKLSLFYALSVTAGIQGHQHLLSLCTEPKLAITIQKSDLLMAENSGQVFVDPADTPMNRLKETPPGRAVLSWIQQNNSALSTIISSAGITASFWKSDNATVKSDIDAKVTNSMLTKS